MYQNIKSLSNFVHYFFSRSKGFCILNSSFPLLPSPPANSRFSFLLFTPHPSPDAAKADCLNSAKANEISVSHNLALFPPVPPRRKCEGSSTTSPPPRSQGVHPQAQRRVPRQGHRRHSSPFGHRWRHGRDRRPGWPTDGTQTFRIFRVRFVLPTPIPRKVNLRCKLGFPPRNRRISLKGSWPPSLHCLIVFMLYLCSRIYVPYTEKFLCRFFPYFQIDTHAICVFLADFFPCYCNGLLK